MIEVNAVFDTERIKQMGKTKRITNYVIFPLIALVMLGGGIASLISGVSGVERIGSIIIICLSPVVVFLTFFMTRSETKQNIKQFGVDKDVVVMNYKFTPQGILIERTTLGRTDRETLAFSELYKVKRTKDYFMLFVNKEEMFYVPCDSFVSGTPDELFNYFYERKVILDY